MISLSTCTAVPSTWSRHIAVYFSRTCKGCRHAPRMFIIDQNFQYSFFLIPEFLLWASCPWPNHCCLTQVTHGKQKQKTHSCLLPSSSEVSFPWHEWPTSTPAVTLMALAQLSPCLSASGSTLATVLSSEAKNGWTKLFLARNVSSKFRKGREISWTWIMWIMFIYRCFLPTVKLKVRVSLSISLASCLHFSSRKKTTVFKTYLVQWNVGQSSCHDSCWETVRGVPKIITFCPVQWRLLSWLWWRFSISN